MDGILMGALLGVAISIALLKIKSITLPSPFFLAVNMLSHDLYTKKSGLRKALPSLTEFEAFGITAAVFTDVTHRLVTGDYSYVSITQSDLKQALFLKLNDQEDLILDECLSSMEQELLESLVKKDKKLKKRAQIYLTQLRNSVKEIREKA